MKRGGGAHGCGLLRRVAAVGLYFLRAELMLRELPNVAVEVRDVTLEMRGSEALTFESDTHVNWRSDAI